MKLLKVACAVLNQIPMHWEHNKKNIVQAIEDAKEKNVSVLCLPELCISGYGCEDMFYSPNVLEQSIRVLYEVLPHTKGIITCVGLPMMYQNRTFNACALLVDGKIAGFVAKRFLAGNGIHYEPRWFTPWIAEKHINLSLQNPQTKENESYLFGDVYFDIGGIKIGFEICEDAWVAHRPGRALSNYGIDVIMNPSASHFAFNKINVRKRFVLEGSRAFGVAYLYANLLGNESGRAIYDGGTIIASAGEIANIGQRLSFHDVLVTSAVVDIDANRIAQSQSSMNFDLPNSQENKITVPYNFPNIEPEPYDPSESKWEYSNFIQEEEFTRALALGLFDYLRKSRSNGFVVSLSGGADSAAVSCCVYLLIKLGIENIGLEQFKKKLYYISAIQDLKTVDEISNKLLLTAYQPTENSSDTTENAADKLAKALNATHYTFNINEVVKEYHKIIEQGLDRKLAWQTDDIALQNIQARVRAPSVWMIANIYNALLLSTSNRSEAAVGYATMDGDTSGGLSPIAGIDKFFLRNWLKWLETKGVLTWINDTESSYFKIEVLKSVNVQQPTAELRPSENKQTDEDDLMPYDLLDAIEEAAIRDKKSPADCLKLLKQTFKQYDDKKLKEWTIKFFRLWSRNQWKRERYAPSFHLDDKNLDPKTWCRFPILSSSFEYELEQL
ncbi:NAD+ synthetase [Bernardetia litoralis DSM 6794]|uniref:Glutamine-dependent NAD(+) synthetase n=1 Tax=Bernardetia litoralis (strain ATCC 23117 / DSM 6794 / NBRC 15988 / NCIMB 1366 / Fx l1 / Sio-4) TaxID=880071 RepID=I4AIN6_BERLS|nr:NAD(+) synthase [Bernardetia litoralis]AFM03821.1 NAD+ synthetase [Bernardetia litoralis DSM 6794]